MMQSTLHRTSIDLAGSVREPMIDLLNQQLADTFDLHSHTKQAHWNVKGGQFIALHELFDTLAGELNGYIDMIAERAVILGGTAFGTARLAAANTRLEEYPADIASSEDHVRALVARFASLAESTRAAIGRAADAGDDSTADLFTEVSRGLDKALWFLEAHIQA